MAKKQYSEGIRITPSSIYPLKNGNYETTSVFAFTCRVGGYVYDIEIDEGFEFDGATVPRILWFIADAPYEAPRVTAALMHDWLYTTHAVDRETADILFYEAMFLAGCKPSDAKRDYDFVRIFGRFCWDNNTYEDIEHATKLGRLRKSVI